MKKKDYRGINSFVKQYFTLLINNTIKILLFLAEFLQVLIFPYNIVEH